MAKEFHMAKPAKTFSGDNMDIYIQCDYPVECFGAPEYYVAYLNYKGKEIALGAGGTEKELLIELYTWRANPAVYDLIKNDVERFRQRIGGDTAQHTKYPGWRNFETWAVGLWMDNYPPAYEYWIDAARDANDANALAERMRNESDDMMPKLQEIWGDALPSTLQAVDWLEIAKYRIDGITYGGVD